MIDIAASEENEEHPWLDACRGALQSSLHLSAIVYPDLISLTTNGKNLRRSLTATLPTRAHALKNAVRAIDVLVMIGNLSAVCLSVHSTTSGRERSNVDTCITTGRFCRRVPHRRMTGFSTVEQQT